MTPLLRQAEAMIERGRYDMARSLLDRALQQDPDGTAPRLMIAQLHLTEERWGEARRVAQEIIRLDPECGHAFYQLACGVFFDETYVPPKEGPWWKPRNDPMRGRPALATRLLHEAMRLDPQCAPYHAMHAVILLNQEKWAEGLGAAERGLAIDPHDSSCASARVQALQALGRTREARAMARSALRDRPEDSRLHASAAAVAMSDGDFDTALEHSRQALRDAPSSREMQDLYWAAARAHRGPLRPFVVLQALLLRLQQPFHRLQQRWGFAAGAVTVAGSIVLAVFLLYGGPAWMTPVVLVLAAAIAVLFLLPPVIDILTRWWLLLYRDRRAALTARRMDRAGR